MYCGQDSAVLEEQECAYELQIWHLWKRESQLFAALTWSLEPCPE